MLLFACFLQVTKENVENETNAEESENDLNLKAGENLKDDSMHEDMVTESAAGSQKDDAKVDHNSEEKEAKEGTSPNVSGSSDMVSGTPQKSISRRQSFITLEKYLDGKSTSPDVSSTFTGPHTKITSSQKTRMTNESNSPMESQGFAASTPRAVLSVGKENSQCAASQTPESPLRPKESLTKCEPVRLTERMSSGPAEEDDVIPDTQTDAKGEETSKGAEVQPSSQEETSQPNLDDSQTPWYRVSPGEPRRSGRHRVPPTLPGEDLDDRDSKYIQFKQKRSGDHLKSDSPNSDSSQGGPKTRSRQAAEEESSKHRLRTRSQRDQAGSSQTPSQGRTTKKIKLYSNSEQFLEKIERPESRRRSRDCSQTGSQSDKESQSQGRHSRRSKGSPRTKREEEMSVEVWENSQDSSQNESTNEEQAGSPAPGTTAAAQEFKGTVDNETSKEDSHTTTQSSEDKKATSSSNESLQTVGAEKQLSDTEVKSMLNDTSEDCPALGEDSRSNQSHMQSEAARVTEDVTERQNTSNSQIRPTAAGKKEPAVGVRTRRSKAAVPAQEGSLSTPESSQSQSLAESTDSSQGRSRSSRRRSSQALVSLESSESETTAQAENIHVPKKRGRKPRISLQSSPTVESPKNERNNVSDHEQSLKAEHETADDSQKSHDLQDSELLRKSQTEVKAAAAAHGGETAVENTSLQEEKQIPKNANADNDSHEADTTELQSSEKCEPCGSDAKQPRTLCSLDEVSAAAEPGDGDENKHKSLEQAHPVDPNEACHTAGLAENQMECLHGSDEPLDEGKMQKDELAEASGETTSVQKTDEKHAIQTQEYKEEEETISEDGVDTSDVFSPTVIPESAVRDADSPSKLKDLEALMGPDVNHSPSSRVRGAWSPSASPSTSILKRGQKRALEDETPSPLVKVSNESCDPSRA